VQFLWYVTFTPHATIPIVSTYDPLNLVGQERTKAEQEAQKRIDEELADKDLKWLMGSSRGRRIVWRLLEEAGVFRVSFNTNALLMAFAEGNRNFGNKLLASIMRLCPELHPVMVREATNGRRDDGKQSN